MNRSVRDSKSGDSLAAVGGQPGSPVSNTGVQAMREQALTAWREPHPDAKCLAVMQLGKLALNTLPLSGLDRPAKPISGLLTGASRPDDIEPGRPDKPELVLPKQLARRRAGSVAGRGAMLHAIAHIEFNAINLALDAVWRFPQMPVEFTADWISVAVDEARHFQLLTVEMSRDGYLYGDFDAHDGLWDMARKTADDLLARMAVVPRVMEARGLDATPVIQKKLRSVGDTSGVDILQIILDEEIRHVRIGDYWFRQLCAQRGESVETCFRALLDKFDAPRPNGYINRAARLAAGFSEAELQWLSTPANSAPTPAPVAPAGPSGSSGAASSAANINTNTGKSS